MTPDTNITGLIRVSIVERLVPSLAFAVAAIAGAVGGFMILRFLNDLRTAETAGYGAFFTGTKWIEIVVGTILVVAAALGAIGLLVSVIRLFTTNQKASPPGVLFLIEALLSLVPAFAVHYAVHWMKEVVQSPPTGGLSEIGGTVGVISYFAMGSALLIIVGLLAYSFIPFTSRGGRKLSPFICLIVAELLLAALAGIFFWEARNSVNARNELAGPDYRTEPAPKPATTNTSPNGVSGGVPVDVPYDTPEPSTSSSSAKTISGGVLNGKAIRLPQPSYPAVARAVKASGAVNVQVTVDVDGKVISATAVSGHALLRAAAVMAAREARFSPTLLGGERVKVNGVIVYNFKLEE